MTARHRVKCEGVRVSQLEVLVLRCGMCSLDCELIAPDEAAAHNFSAPNNMMTYFTWHPPQFWVLYCPVAACTLLCFTAVSSAELEMKVREV